MLKSFHNEGREPDLYFWRDSSGHEIDLLLEEGGELTPVEIKSGQTVASDFYTGLFGWRRLTEQPDGAAGLIYGGDRSFTRSGIVTLSWTTL